MESYKKERHQGDGHDRALIAMLEGRLVRPGCTDARGSPFVRMNSHGAIERHDPAFPDRDPVPVEDTKAWLEDLVAEAHLWICPCGAECSPANPEWRWRNRGWEHYHGRELGFLRASRQKELT